MLRNGLLIVLFFSSTSLGALMSKDFLLYVGEPCPYCKRVTDFMKEHAISIPIVDVWKSDAAAEELRSLSGKGQVPCLKIGKDKYMHESLEIIEYLKKQFIS